jgi:outer membrane protein OmpU
MKKVLLATTALALMAGAAHAEVAVSGDARFGFVNVEGGDTTLERRARIKFAGSGTTDGGLTFGASFRSHLNATDGNANNTGNVYISGAFGTLSVGSESSAAEYAVGDLAGVGFTGAGAGNENNFGGASVVYTYSTDALTAMVSIGESAGNGGNTLDNDTLAMGVSYAAGAVTVAVGYEMGAADDHIIAGVTYAMGDTTVKATYGTQGDDSQMGASVAHKMGSISLAGFYRTTETGGADADFYGVGAAYDLGGGAAVKAGFANNDGTTRMEAGINLSF